MEFENKKLRDVADIAARIMMGEKALHPNQQKLDVHEPEKDELTADDFKKLRSMKKEETMHEESCKCGDCPSEKVEEGVAETLKKSVADKGKVLADINKKQGLKLPTHSTVYSTGADGKLTTTVRKMKEEVEEVEEGIVDKVKSVLSRKPKSGNLFDQPHVKKDTAEYLKKSAKQPQGPNNVTNIMKKEEVDLDEGKMAQLDADLKDLSHADFHKEYGKPKSHYDPSNFKKPVQAGKEMDRAKALAQRGMASMKKEEVEELEEMFPGTPEYEKKYGKAPQDMKPGEKKKTTKGEMEKTGKGVVHRRKFSEMVESYSDGGIKGFFKTLAEEPTNAEFTAQLDDAKKRADGTKKQPEVSKPAVQAVQNEQTHTTVEFIDYNDVNGVKVSEIDLAERKLTDAETDKKEEIVKSMKKGLSGFKERYGKDAKSVMYATATSKAKGE